MSNQQISKRNAITVGELIAFLGAQDPNLPIAAACQCFGQNWSTYARDAYLAAGTATRNKPHVVIGTAPQLIGQDLWPHPAPEHQERP